MISRAWVFVVVSSALLCGLLPVEVEAQDAPEWTKSTYDQRSSERATSGSARTAEQRGKNGYGSRGKGQQKKEDRKWGRGLHIPKGHLPPAGQCRLWYPGRPPGQQPAPTSCRAAYRQLRGAAVVVTHNGDVHPRPEPRWRARPSDDIVFRRPPRDEGVHFRVEVIIDILGRSSVRRLEERKRRLGLSGALTGRWVSTDRSDAAVLRIQAGGHPLAELIDRTGNARVDAFYLREDG